MRVKGFLARQPGFEIQPARFYISRAPVRALETISVINNTITVKQDIERVAGFLHPLLEGWQCAKGNDKDTRIELFEFVLARAQLCGMFAAGYSAKVAQENEQHMIAAFEHFIKSNLLAFNRLQAEVRCGRVWF